MSKSVKPALQTKTTPNQTVAFKGHVYTMAAAFAGVIFGVLGSMGFVGTYLDSQFAAQTAALDKRIVAAAPASSTTVDGCYGTSSASTAPTTTASAKVGHAVAASAMPAAQVGGRGAEEAVKPSGHNGGSSAPFVNQLISGSISNTGPGSTATINATNNFNYTQTNNNNVNVSNSSNQTSSTGSATTSNNTNAGSSTSGDSDNTNATHSDVYISN